MRSRHSTNLFRTRAMTPAMILAMILATLALGACGGAPEPEEPPPKPEETIIATQARAMNKARDVEQQLNDSATQRLEEIDRMSTGEQDDNDGTP